MSSRLLFVTFTAVKKRQDLDFAFVVNAKQLTESMQRNQFLLRCIVINGLVFVTFLENDVFPRTDAK